MVTGAGTGTGPSVVAGDAITCGFCGVEFREDPGQAACQACPLSRACGLVRCPHCGFENPKQPGWLAKLRRWIP
jgi:hypothetical protein